MTCLILVSINIKASAAALPLVVHSGHRHNSHLNINLGFVLMLVTSAYLDYNDLSLLHLPTLQVFLMITWCLCRSILWSRKLAAWLATNYAVFISIIMVMVIYFHPEISHL